MSHIGIGAMTTGVPPLSSGEDETGREAKLASDLPSTHLYSGEIAPWSGKLGTGDTQGGQSAAPRLTGLIPKSEFAGPADGNPAMGMLDLSAVCDLPERSFVAGKGYVVVTESGKVSETNTPTIAEEDTVNGESGSVTDELTAEKRQGFLEAAAKFRKIFG